MENLDNAVCVVALVTKNSIDRPWILYEVGVASGKLGTTAFGIALGVPLEAASRGPFAQFHNSESDEDSLVKLVCQIIKPYAAPRTEVVRTFVRSFRDQVEEVLKAPSKSADLVRERSEDNAARLFEEIKISVGDIPRIAKNLDRLFPAASAAIGTSRSSIIKRIQPTQLTYAVSLEDRSQTIRLSSSWSSELQRLGWPDGPGAKKLLADVERWILEDPSRLTINQEGWRIDDIRFGLIVRQSDGVPVFRNFHRMARASQ
jgi:hypothetical protein